ncbi:hypothetical protein D1B33_03740 [Lysinibacillus yapensis]|uniref:N-acetylmuramoyl-L-alanine amidase n=1 Tax=Ureibacillus yapensis TaxID=2304605 RepID=A0A396SKS6_9BACL|nr:N-acetylmuramoyl-L-alanine amidase [Lysinibacillus yapensis]RHW39969.1 hypothetical protein D1B33_03740 [Lysinibacillus yapensis]
MERRRFLYSLFLMLLCLVIIPNKFASANSLSDIPNAYKEEVNYLIGKNIIFGYEDGTFKPNQLVSRQEAATMMGRALKLDGSTPRQTVFSDVNPNSYAAGYIQSANDKGIISGYGNGTFGPTKNMTRLEMAYLISSAFNLSDSGDVFYVDMPQASGAKAAIAGVTNAGITNGYTDGTFKPSSSITRVEFSLMLARALNPDFKVEPIKMQGSTKYVTASSLNVRKGPGANYDRIGSLTKGASITAYGSSGDWAFIENGNVKGYVHTAYLSSTKPTVASASTTKGKVIAIDPGHGGHDPGAVGNGLREKDIVLGVGLELKKYLEAAGIKVVMTRSTDKFIPLDDRPKIAKNAGADTFVSLHMNAASASANGTETFYSKGGSSTRVNQSSALAGFIQDRLLDTLDSRDRGVKTANYLVIYQNTLPSVLVEMGFISNKAEATYINSHQKETAQAIYLGIMDYYKWLGK